MGKAATAFGGAAVDRRMLYATAVALAAVVLAATWSTREPPAAGPADAAAVLRSLSAPVSQKGASVGSLPTQAQGVISSALGRDDAQFAPRRRKGELRLAAGGVAGRFAHGQVIVGARGERLSLGLSVIGRGESLRPVDAVAPSAQRNRVTYRHRRGVTEWYTAGPLGIEQGFTIARSPAPGTAPLTLALPARGSLRPRVTGSEAEFVTPAGRVALRYGGLSVLDAAGRRVHAWLDAAPAGLLLRVDDRRAQYPLRIDPFLQEGSRLLAPRSSFGFSVALSSDGNTAVIGGPTEGASQGSAFGPAPARGAAWVFTRSGSTWTQQGPKLTPRDESGNGWFGWSVALSGDGNTAVIGGPTDNDIGAAWVFTRSGSNWTQQGAKLTGAGRSGSSGLFGWSVALSRDGTTAMISDPADNQATGGVWVYTRSGTTWTQQGAKLVGSGVEAGDQFGTSVALSTDGSTAVVGGPGDGNRVGAAWVFTRSGATWTQQGSKLTGSGEIGSGEFGWDVALSGDGNTALIGGRSDNNLVGAAWVFTRSGSTWTQQGAKLTGSGQTGEGAFGTSVALSTDGSTALIGAPTDNGNVGAAWVFTRAGTTWTQQGSKLTGSDRTGNGVLGWGVALSADGATALVGGYFDNSTIGAAWAFTRSGTTWTQQGAKLSTGAGENGSGEFGSSVALSDDGNLALIAGPHDSNNIGAVWVFARRAGGVWAAAGPKLTGSDQAGAAEFGTSVSLSGDGDTALIGGPGDNRATGAAWVFTRSGSTWTQQGSKLTGSDESGAGGFGAGVALSADGATAMIGAPGDNTRVGAAWVFTRSGTTWTQQGAKLTGAGETGAGQFGASVALSGNGNVALAGGPIDNVEVGAAWVFTRSGSTWTQQGSKLTGAGEVDDGKFGSTVALSQDGATALIGGPDDDNLVGAAWVFSRSGSTWTQQGAKLTALVPDLFFGNGVALDADGNTALIGAYGEDNTVGAAWVFSRSGSTWTRQLPKLVADDPNPSGGSQFGASVALSGDGRTALIGGPKDFGPFLALPGTSPPIAGAAWVFIVPEAAAITSAPSTTFTTGQPGSFTVTTSGFSTPTLSEAGALPAGVTFVDNGDGTATLSGTPAAGTGGVYRFTITAANGVGPDAVQNFTLTVAQRPAITSAALATFTTGQAGTFTVSSTGVPAPALSVQGTLPSGVSLADNGDGSARLAGTPAAGSGGTYRLTITATNVAGTATQEFILTVTQRPAIASAATATFSTGRAESFTVTTSGFPAPALSEAGALPAGVSFTDNGNGTATLGGTPTATGVFTFTITATNTVAAATQQFTLTVGRLPAITSAATATFTTGQAGTFTVTSTGVPTPTLSVQGGPLPDGVTYVDNQDGTATIAGTPAADTGGTYRLTITAANGISPDATQILTVVVRQPPRISAAGALFTVGRSGSFTIDTSGFPAPALSLQGTLPAGVSFADNGDGTATLAGTPAAGTSGAYPLTITARNGVAPDATQVITLNVGQGPAITSGAATTFTTGQAGTFTVTTTGFPAPILSVNGTLPAGVTFTDNRDGTATLAGTPAADAGGVYRFTVRAANGIAADATQVFTLTVAQPPAITSAAAAAFTVDQAASFTVRSTGFPTAALSVAGPLPAGVGFTDNGDGTATLAGTPTATGAHSLTITAANGVSPNATQSFSLTVEQAPAITSDAGATFRTGQAGRFVVASDGFPAAALSVAGALPAGVTFTDSGNGTAILAGTPAADAGGVYRVTVTAANGVSPDATQDFTLTVEQPPAITSAAAATFRRGQAAGFTVTSSGFPAVALSLAGALPPGLTFTDDGDGTATLAGTPAARAGGVYRVTITAANGVAPDATQAFALTVAVPAQPRPPSPPSAPPPPPPPPATASLRLRAPALSVFGRRGSTVRCRMRSGEISACRVRLVRRGRVLAVGRAQRPVAARRLTVSLQLTKRGRALLDQRLGGVRARLRARAVTSGGIRSAGARTRALRRVERFTTPPGAWLPSAPALSPRGERFLHHLRGRLVAVAGLRCAGHSAHTRGLPRAHGPVSLARATVLCRALAKLAGGDVRTRVVSHGNARPIASNDTAAGRAKNRRVVVIVTHRR